MAINRRELKKNIPGSITRRKFIKTTLTGLAAAGVGSAILPRHGSAKPERIVHCNWGGDAIRCYQESFGKGFTAKTGVKVVFDGTGPDPGLVKAQFDAKNVTWDVLALDVWIPPRLARLGMLEPIDYSIVDKSKVLPNMVWEYGVGSYMFASVLTYDTQKVGNNPPKTWADLWNIEKYPGKRALHKGFTDVFEIALLADGVPADKLYPLDVDRALKKIREIKRHTFFWGSNAEVQQMFYQGEIVMGQVFNSRASILERDTNGRVRWTWNQGVYQGNAWGVPKGNPAGREWAMRWIAWLQDAKGQVDVLKCLGVGPTNPAATQFLDADSRRISPGFPENLKQLIPIDVDWYDKNATAGYKALLDEISH